MITIIRYMKIHIGKMVIRLEYWIHYHDQSNFVTSKDSFELIMNYIRCCNVRFKSNFKESFNIEIFNQDTFNSINKFCNTGDIRFLER